MDFRHILINFLQDEKVSHPLILLFINAPTVSTYSYHKKRYVGKIFLDPHFGRVIVCFEISIF